MKLSKKNSYYFGHIGEIIAAIFLLLNFYWLLARRFRTPFGEIDLIAQKKNQLIFIEIKSRNNFTHREVISTKQKERITSSAQFFILKNKKYQNFYVRFDVIFINKYLIPKHIKNYW